MSLALQSWYILKDALVDDNSLVVRFHPDHFTTDIVEPVLTITIESPDDINCAQRQLERFRHDFIVDIVMVSSAVEFWAEYDDVATVISGRDIHCSWSEYSAPDLIAIACSLREDLNKLHTENASLHANKRALERFVTELLRRADAKKSLTARSTVVADAQIDVLNRLLNRIRGT